MAVTNLGRALVDLNEELDQETAMWVDDVTFAAEIATRMVKAFAGGMGLWRVRTTAPKPWLEPGDTVVLETDRFVGRDPNTGNPVRGHLNGLGRVQAVHDLMGTEFTVWITSIYDILPTAQAIAWSGFESPSSPTGIEIDFDANGNVEGKRDWRHPHIESVRDSRRRLGTIRPDRWHQRRRDIGTVRFGRDVQEDHDRQAGFREGRGREP